MTFAVLGTYLLSGWFSSNNNIIYKNGRRLMTKVPGDEEIRNYDEEKQEDIGVTKKAERFKANRKFHNIKMKQEV